SAGARGPSAAARTGADAPAPPSASAGPAPSGNPADPRTPEDLLLAARSGYSSALEKAGLRLSADGKGFVRVADGKPASAEDLERLRAAVVAMPAAIARRPDFHQKVPPEHFAALQSGYRREDRSPSVYKDVGATEKQRDFIHTRSCEKVSGDCNENTTRAFYKKGEHVSPEDLERMFQALSEELAAAEAEAEPDGAAPGRGESRPPLQAEEAAEVAASVSATRTVTLAEDEAAAFAAAPALLPTTLRRAWAKAVVAVSPSAAKTPAGRGALLAGLLAFAAAVALPFLRRRG
ncbi:MAG: hypothetical protein SF051_01150, partial [Elusimicrobiota bacterium]|nr:hypothetical protein [Elusimicrobiota bacterium]